VAPVRFALPALLAAFLAASGTGARLPARKVPLTFERAAPKDGLAEVGCPTGTLPDGNACVHVPGDGDGDSTDAPELPNAHRERSGQWAQYAQIPRRPERPDGYDLYKYPIPPGLPGGHYVVSGYDLDRPDAEQRRGRTLRAIGHGGVDLPQKKGTPVKLVALEHQKGDADVLYTGHLFGTTVVTRHTLREAGQLRDYVVLYGHLDAIAPGLAAGASVKDGDVVGFVGDTGSPELVHLHLETRRVREGVDIGQRVAKTGAGEILADNATVVCDPRNVLPLQ
jgi:murein DD-endopeptidase MepM/ murein hydrolase activator NlpD